MISVRLYRCPESGCGQYFTNNWKLSRHVQRKHPSGDQLDLPFKCHVADCLWAKTGFFDASKLKRHLQTHTSTFRKRKSSDGSAPAKRPRRFAERSLPSAAQKAQAEGFSQRCSDFSEGKLQFFVRPIKLVPAAETRERAVFFQELFEEETISIDTVADVISSHDYILDAYDEDGRLEASVCFDFQKHRGVKLGYIALFKVSPLKQGGGMGRFVLTACEQILLRSEAQFIALWSVPWAVDFYLGMRYQQMHVPNADGIKLKPKYRFVCPTANADGDATLFAIEDFLRNAGEGRGTTPMFKDVSSGFDRVKRTSYPAVSELTHTFGFESYPKRKLLV